MGFARYSVRFDITEHECIDLIPRGSNESTFSTHNRKEIFTQILHCISRKKLQAYDHLITCHQDH
jgi:hypothetical protein